MVSKAQVGRFAGLMGVVLQVASIALLALSLAQPAFFSSYFPTPTPNSNFQYKTDQYGPDCVVANIGLLSSRYNPLCSGGVTSGNAAFEVPTTEYYPLFPIRLIENQHNPLSALQVPYTGCSSTIDAVYQMGANMANDAGRKLYRMISPLPEVLFTDASHWTVPNGAGYQALQSGMQASGLSAADIAETNATVVPLLQGCTAAENSSLASCGSFIIYQLVRASPLRTNAILSIAFNKPITSRDQAVHQCEDDEEDYDALVKARAFWITALALACAAFVAGAAGNLIAEKKQMVALVIASVFAVAAAGFVLLALMELNGAPAAKDVTGKCVAGVACYEKESNVVIGLVALILSALGAILYTTYAGLLFVSWKNANEEQLPSYDSDLSDVDNKSLEIETPELDTGVQV